MIWDEIMSDMTNMTWKMNQQDWQRKIFYSQQQISDCMWFEYILTSDFQEKQIYIDVFLSTNISKLRISAMSLCLCQPDVWGLTVVFCIGEQLAERPMAVGVCGVWYRTQHNETWHCFAISPPFTSISGMKGHKDGGLLDPWKCLRPKWQDHRSVRKADEGDSRGWDMVLLCCVFTVESFSILFEVPTISGNIPMTWLHHVSLA